MKKERGDEEEGRERRKEKWFLFNLGFHYDNFQIYENIKII